MTMIYGSVCSGIEAATVAWHELGWKPSFFSEIDKFPRAVLAHHYPDTPCHGDFTTIKENDYEPIQLLVGGTPCQSFSVAGLRGGLSDDRGNLCLEFIRLAQRLKPRWTLWENVPGVLSSNGGRDFGTFLGGLAECGYGFAWRVLDAQYFGVPQRRRRIFVVGHLGDWKRPAEVLFERESLRGDLTPRREARQDAPAVAGTISSNGGGTSSPAGNANELDFCVPQDVAGTLGSHKSGGCGRYDLDTSGAYIPVQTHCLNAGGMGRQDFETETLIAATQAGHGAYEEGVGTLQNISVRRLTPRECERLQGFPDDYTKIDEKTADGPRYKALGNSMAVPVMRWIGQRIHVSDSERTKK